MEIFRNYCPKCRNEKLKVKYTQEQNKYSGDDSIKEFLQVTCENCGYTYQAHCLDTIDTSNLQNGKLSQVENIRDDDGDIHDIRKEGV